MFIGGGFWGVEFVVFPLIGLVGCAGAMYSGFLGRNHTVGAVCGVVATVGNFPGLLTFGVFGMSLSIVALALHLAGRSRFES